MNVVFLGSSMLDECYLLNSSGYPKLGGKALVTYLGTELGGTAANAAAIGVSLGIKATLIYEFSDFEETTNLIIDDLKKYKISTDGLSYANRHNPRCLLIREPEGEKTIFILNDHLLPKIKLSDKQEEILLKSEYVYTSINDIQLFENKESIFKSLLKNGIGIFIDCDSNINLNEISDLKFATIVSFNEFGYKNLHSLGYNAHDLIEKFNVNWVIVTKGKNGSRVYSKEGILDQEALSTVVKDTTGAGDGFNIGFLFGLLNGMKLPDCLLFAAGVSSVIISHIGPRIHVDINEIHSIYNKYKVNSLC